MTENERQVADETGEEKGELPFVFFVFPCQSMPSFFHITIEPGLDWNAARRGCAVKSFWWRGQAEYVLSLDLIRHLDIQLQQIKARTSYMTKNSLYMWSYHCILICQTICFFALQLTLQIPIWGWEFPHRLKWSKEQNACQTTRIQYGRKNPLSSTSILN